MVTSKESEAGKKRSRVAVIGGGISGLTCARELSRNGFEVVTFERERTVGGRMNTRIKGGFSFDFGADFLADCYLELHRMANQLGVDIRSAGLVRHVFVRDGRLNRMNVSSVGDLVRLDGLSWWTRIRLLLLAVYCRWRVRGLNFFDLSTIPPELNRESAYDFACRTVSKEFADYIVDPFTTCMMFYRSRELGAGVFLALFSNMVCQKYSFGVEFAQGAMKSIPRMMAQQLDVRLNTPVECIRHDGDRIVVATSTSSELFDRVVVSTPANISLRILQDPTPVQHQLLAGVEYSRTIDVSFRIPVESLKGFHCCYVPYVESRIISEFTNEMIKGAETVHDGITLVNVGLHESAARWLLNCPDEEVFSAVKAELLRICAPLAAVANRVEPHDLQRWLQAIPKYTGDHVARVQAFWKDGQGDRNVYLCGDYMNAPWLEGSVRCGKRVAGLIHGVAPVTSAASEPHSEGLSVPAYR